MNAASTAASAGTEPEAIVKDATMRLLNEGARFCAAVPGSQAQDEGQQVKKTLPSPEFLFPLLAAARVNPADGRGRRQPHWRQSVPH